MYFRTPVFQARSALDDGKYGRKQDINISFFFAFFAFFSHFFAFFRIFEKRTLLKQL